MGFSLVSDLIKSEHLNGFLVDLFQKGFCYVNVTVCVYVCEKRTPDSVESAATLKSTGHLAKSSVFYLEKGFTALWWSALTTAGRIL